MENLSSDESSDDDLEEFDYLAVDLLQLKIGAQVMEVQRGAHELHKKLRSATNSSERKQLKDDAAALISKGVQILDEIYSLHFESARKIYPNVPTDFAKNCWEEYIGEMKVFIKLTNQEIDYLTAHFTSLSVSEATTPEGEST